MRRRPGRRQNAGRASVSWARATPCSDAHADPGLTKSAAYERRTPFVFGHGSRDTVFPIENQEALLARFGKNYPVRFIRFETGTHGTPIRMVDWRAELNWMLTRR